jgi:nucleoporin SEH1
VSWADPEFG